MPITLRRLALPLACLVASAAFAATPDAATMDRGEKLFLANCVICHGVTGLGAGHELPVVAAIC